MAAMAVVWIHLMGAYGVGALGFSFNTPLHILFNGAGAVSLFFVLSGFVLSFRFLNDKQQPQLSLSAFYSARFFRICVPFVIMWLASFYIYVNFFDAKAALEYGGYLPRGWQRAGNVVLSDIGSKMWLFLPGTFHRLVPQAWTLTIEIQMSLVLPFLMWGCRHSVIALLALLVGAVTLGGAPIFSVHFVLGVVLARYYHSITGWLKPRPLWQPIAIAVVSLYCYNYRFWPPAYKLAVSSDTEWILMALGSGGVLLLALSRPGLQDFLNQRFLVKLGKISYSLYLVHFLVLTAMWPSIDIWTKDLPLSDNLTHGLVFILLTILVVLLSWLFYLAVEKPCHLLGRYVSQAINRRTILIAKPFAI
jgi:peptidoglycan/LPS O-acetylase OafA/YrhL